METAKKKWSEEWCSFSPGWPFTRGSTVQNLGENLSVCGQESFDIHEKYCQHIASVTA